MIWELEKVEVTVVITARAGAPPVRRTVTFTDASGFSLLRVLTQDAVRAIDAGISGATTGKS